MLALPSSDAPDALPFHSGAGVGLNHRCRPPPNPPGCLEQVIWKVAGTSDLYPTCASFFSTSSGEDSAEREVARRGYLWQHPSPCRADELEAEEAKDHALLRTVLGSDSTESAVVHGLQGVLQHGRWHALRSVHDHRCAQPLPDPAARRSRAWT